MLRRIQVISQREKRVEIAAANQRTEDGHVLINSDDIALLKIAFVPLVMEMEDHRDDLKRLIKKYIVSRGEQQRVKIMV